jgi:hypothetical protein
MIEVLEDRLDRETGIAQHPLLLQSSFGGTTTVAEADIETTVGLEQAHGSADEEAKALQRVRRVGEHGTKTAVKRSGHRFAQVVLDADVIEAVLLGDSVEEVQNVAVRVEDGRTAPSARELHGGRGQVVVAEKHQATLVLAGIEE